jgi:putative serine protease PepD
MNEQPGYFGPPPTGEPPQQPSHPQAQQPQQQQPEPPYPAQQAQQAYAPESSAAQPPRPPTPPQTYQGMPVGPPPPPAGGAGRRTVIAAAVIAALIGGGVGAGTVAWTGNNGSNSSSPGLTFSTQVAPAAKTDGTIEAAAAKIGPSVVTIVVTAAREQDTGSGVIIRQDGYILTNNHVIAAAKGGGGNIVVTLADGKQATAKIVGTDPPDDLAVIKIDKTGLTAATFASSSSLKVGQTVVAVGAPLGLSDTVTSGIVSTIARPVTTSDDQNDQAVFNAVQTDAAINPGNSGGPLVNLNGAVVGINAAIATDQSQGGLQLPGQQSQSGNIGIGFAIPSDEASRIAGELISTGKATHAVLGVEVKDAAANTATTSAGALISSVKAGSPAAKAGLKSGDLVTSLDGQRITEAVDLVAAVRSHAPGQKVDVVYTRDGSSHTTSLTLGSGSN